MEIKVTKTTNPKPIPQGDNLSFGKYYTDHMFEMDYTEEKGWHNAQIVPYGPITMDPTSLVLHYGQETFEGLKAYRSKANDILLFRPEANGDRMVKSNERLCMAPVPTELFVEAIKSLLEIDKDWVPSAPGTSLYIRPFVFATQAEIGVKPSTSYKFMVLASPVSAYYSEGVKPVKIWVESEYVRAVQGGTGFAKCGGNYAASLLAQTNAAKKGYTQVLWLDGVERKYVEEVGTMNAMFVINDVVVTAPIDGSVLAGITRDSVITLLKDWGYTVEERKLSIDELMNAGKDGSLKEAFGTGTAAVISPIGELCYKGESITINNFETGTLTQRIYDTLTGIQSGEVEDKHNWVTTL